MSVLRRLDPADVAVARVEPVDPDTLAAAREIVDRVAAEGEAALLEYRARLDPSTGPLVHDRAALGRAFERLPQDTQALLERVAGRIRRFAEAQRACLSALDMAVPGGAAGHDVAPVEAAGCYAPGGRFPLPSSVLMTAVTARAAGVEAVWVASPRDDDLMLGAAFVAGADAFLAAGGAHAIAALAFGAGPVPRVDVIVGPGNRWVTAAKQLVSGIVGIDMLAGPSELVVLADAAADPETVAADLLAQAEHDPDARPFLVTDSAALAAAVDEALAAQLADLPTAETAAAALTRGGAVVCRDMDAAIDVVDRLAPEHLELLVADAPAVARRVRHYGGLFVGAGAAEVLGDYGVGPNHVLPTGATARYTGGLSVLDFLRVRTWLRVDDLDAAQGVVADAIALADLEGLAGHARSAARRQRP